LLTKVLEARQRLLGSEHPDTLTSMTNLAILYRSEGKYEEGEALFVKALEVQRRVLGDDNSDALDTMNALALLYMKQLKYARAEALLHQAVNGYQGTGLNTWGRYNCESMLGASLAGQKKYAEAEGLLLSGYEGMVQREATIPAPSRFKVEQAGKWIVQLYQGWGKPEKATEWRQKLHLIPSAVGTQ
jgi:eukaryotic-like serine/threonine-protein kinase